MLRLGPYCRAYASGGFHGSHQPAAGRADASIPLGGPIRSPRRPSQSNRRRPGGPRRARTTLGRSRADAHLRKTPGESTPPWAAPGQPTAPWEPLPVSRAYRNRTCLTPPWGPIRQAQAPQPGQPTPPWGAAPQPTPPWAAPGQPGGPQPGWGDPAASGSAEVRQHAKATRRCSDRGRGGRRRSICLRHAQLQ